MIKLNKPKTLPWQDEALTVKGQSLFLIKSLWVHFYINRKSHDCICNRDRVGGDEGNRTPVRKNLAKGFSERSWCFKSPSVHRPSTGYALWQLLSCDRVRSAPLFTFTSNRRSLHSRGTLCRNEQHSGC
jgi:hypothetical protein